MPKVIADVQLVSPKSLIRPVSIEIGEEGRISQIHEGHHPPDGSEVILDGGGELYLFAGFIDIHTHGAKGADLSQGTLEAVETIAEAKLAEGVTTFFPTTWTASREDTLAMARAAAAYRKNERFARAPLLHVEGPFLNPKQAGAQDPKEMRPPDADEIEQLHDICPVGLLSLAIELPGACDLIRDLRQQSIVTSAAHSAATFADYQNAREAGLKHLTHFCNQMSPLHHREIGLVGAGLTDLGVMTEVICDGIHLCPDMIRLGFQLIGCDRIMLITDSMAASHLGDGVYPLNGTEITVKDGAARIPEGNLAGSVVTFDQALRHAVAFTQLPLNEIAKCCARNQAQSLNLQDRGGIKQGMLADLTLLTPDLEVVVVFVGGEQRYAA
ncbi:MAG: N-acetylglucosamine-6-phosphate deacetylase [Verrucomicrobiota bacterium]